MNRPRTTGDVTRAARVLRLAEAALVMGFIVIGAIFSARSGSDLLSGRFLLLLAAAYFLVVSFYTFNSWAGVEEDAANPRLVTTSTPRGTFLAVSLATLATALSLFALLSVTHVLLACTIYLLGLAYSWPGKGLKYRPPMGTLLHVLVQVPQFACGYALFSDNHLNAAAIGLYFGVAFAAGHVNHELIDRDSDLQAGVNSSAVRYGERVMGVVFLALIALSLLILTVLFLLQIVTMTEALIFGTAGVLQLAGGILLVLLLRSDRRWLLNRTMYRLWYLSAGIALMVTRFV